MSSVSEISWEEVSRELERSLSLIALQRHVFRMEAVKLYYSFIDI
jgi:hypothetical protein